MSRQNETGVGVVEWSNNLVRFLSLLLYLLSSILFSLAPKTYFAIDKDTNDTKRSSKGVQKRYRLTYEDYKAVLYKDETIDAENISIRIFRGEMSTIAVEKFGLQNKMIKAYVDVDKISVSPFKRFQ